METGLYHRETGEPWTDPPIDIAPNGYNPLPYAVTFFPLPDPDPVIGVDCLTGQDIHKSDVNQFGICWTNWSTNLDFGRAESSR